MKKCPHAKVPERNARIFERFQSGETTVAIAKDYDTNRVYIDRIVSDEARRRGVKRRAAVHADRIVLDLATTRGLQTGTLSRAQAAARLGCSRSLISAKLAEMGIEAPRQHKARRFLKVTARGETHYLVEWAEITGIPYTTLHKRFAYGWDAEEALFTPVRVRRKP